MNLSKINLLILLCFLSGVIYFVSVVAGGDRATQSPVLRIGVLPDESEEAIRQRYTPLLKYLSENTQFTVQLVLSENYSDLVDLFRRHKVDLAYFGGLTFLQVHTFYGAEPLVMRDVDTRFTSWFLVKGGDTAEDLRKFKGLPLSFGSRLSTSGHLMPRYFLNSTYSITPENYFSEVVYSGAHDKTAYHVRDGKVSVGVANSEIIKAMMNDGRLNKNDVRIIWKTPPFPDYVWAVQGNLNTDHKTLIRNAFLSLDAGDPVQSKILGNVGAASFLPAGANDFLLLKQVAENLGLLKLDLK